MHIGVRTGLLLIFGVLTAAGIYVLRESAPPSQQSILLDFMQHRPVYEELRIMASNDDRLRRLADWGVETQDSPISEIPPNGSFLVERYEHYLSLMKAGHIRAITRSADPRPEVRFLVWRAGFAGDTRHVLICWRENEPVNQVSDLDTFHESPRPRKPVYKHIDGNWYAWADW